MYSDSTVSFSFRLGDKWKIIQQIDEGGFGTVYKVQNIKVYGNREEDYGRLIGDIGRIRCTESGTCE